MINGITTSVRNTLEVLSDQCVGKKQLFGATGTLEYVFTEFFRVGQVATDKENGAGRQHIDAIERVDIHQTHLAAEHAVLRLLQRLILRHGHAAWCAVKLPEFTRDGVRIGRQLDSQIVQKQALATRVPGLSLCDRLAQQCLTQWQRACVASHCASQSHVVHAVPWRWP